MIILDQIENLQVATTLKYLTDYGKNIYVIFIELCMKGEITPVKCIIKVRNVQMVLFHSETSWKKPCISVIIVSVIAPSVVDREIEPQSGLYKIAICCFFTKYTQH